MCDGAGAVAKRVSGFGSKCAAGVLLLSCGVLAGFAATREETVESVKSRRFELIDKDGKVAGTLACEHGFYPYVELTRGGSQGSGGKIRVEIPSAGGPAITVSDSEGRERVKVFLAGQLERSSEDPSVRLVGGQIPQVILFDDKKRATAVLGSAMDGSGLLELKDKEGGSTFRAPVK